MKLLLNTKGRTVCEEDTKRLMKIKEGVDHKTKEEIKVVISVDIRSVFNYFPVSYNSICVY